MKEKLTITYRKTSELIPYARNSRTHSEEQVAQIAASIQEFGFTNPVLIDEKGIIAGHGRIMGARKLGMEEVPTITLHGLNESQRKAYIIADNKLALNAGWDDEMLRLEIADLKEDGFDLDLLGFEDDELAALEVEETEGKTDQDAIPETPSDPVTVNGDLWTLGNHKLICGDSTNIQTVLRITEENSVDCIWTDPPYNVAYEGTAGKIKNDDMDDGAFRQFLRDAFVTGYAVLKNGAAAYIAHADTEGLNFRAAFKEAGFKLSSCVIWRKNSLVLGRSDYQWQHEPILYGWKPGASHKWYGGRNKTTIQEAEENGIVERVSNSAWKIKLGDDSLIIEGEGDIKISSVLGTIVCEEKPKKNGEHPTMKPVALIERFLHNSTKKANVVLDLFGGSGSTLIACEKMGRFSRLVELDEKFADVIIKRWQDFTGKKAVHDSGKTFDEMAADRGK
jgi:DNA modification methylase